MTDWHQLGRGFDFVVLLSEVLQIFSSQEGHSGKLRSFVLRVLVTLQEGAGCQPTDAYFAPPATLGGLRLLLQVLHLAELPDLEYYGLQTPDRDV